MVTTSNQQNSSQAAKQSRWGAISANFRQKRFELFKSLIAPLPRPLTLLDVGGRQAFWETVNFAESDVNFIIYNRWPGKITLPNFKPIPGDARDMKEFSDQQFDIVFSNSVIEHVGTLEDQRHMAQEVQRVGKRYYLQTPNRHFPIEPHFVLPLFQFFPVKWRAFIALNIKIPWGIKFKNKQDALAWVSSIRLMTEKELRDLFPGAIIYKEKFWGLTKSFTVCKGW